MECVCKYPGCNEARALDGWSTKNKTRVRRYHLYCGHHRYKYRRGLLLRAVSIKQHLTHIGAREICAYKGCDHIQASKGLSNGKKRYGRYCSRHDYLRKRGLDMALNLDKCVVCGWDGPCDIHRIVPGSKGGRYVRGNVEIICPNCHRLKERRLRESG